VHTKSLALAPDVSLRKVAAATPTFSGAELAALTNEAAIRSVRRAVASIASEQGGGGGGGAGMAMPAHSGAGGPVTMADFDSALVDFVTSRRKGPVGGLLGKVLG